jgi:hypothetical protein
VIAESDAERCHNGEDDDLDGLTDCEATSCRAAGVCPETSAASCTDGLDDDGDGLLDAQDPSCFAVVPPALERCASSAGARLTELHGELATLGWIGDPIALAPVGGDRAGYEVPTFSRAGTHVLAVPWTGALDGTALAFDLLHGLPEEDVEVLLVDSASVDPVRGWDGSGRVASVQYNFVGAQVYVQAGDTGTAAVSTIPPPPVPPGGVRRWTRYALRVVARGEEIVAHLAISEPFREGMPPLEVEASAPRPRLGDESLHLVVRAQPSSLGPLQIDGLTVRRPRLDPCGASVPSVGGPTALAGAIRTAAGTCALGVLTTSAVGWVPRTFLVPYRLLGTRLEVVGEALELPDAGHAGLASLERAEDGSIRGVVPRLDAIRGRPGYTDSFTTLHPITAAADCTGWTLGPAESIVSAPQHVALHGDRLWAWSRVGGVERLRSTAAGWVLERSLGNPAVPGLSRPPLVLGLQVLPNGGGADQAELVFVLERPDEPGQVYLAVAPGWDEARVASPLPTTEPIVWVGPSGRAGTFDATSAGAGTLLTGAEGLLYLYESQAPALSCAECGVGLARGASPRCASSAMDGGALDASGADAGCAPSLR